MIQAKYCLLENAFFGVVEKLCAPSAPFFGWAPPPPPSWELLDPSLHILITYTWIFSLGAYIETA